MNIPFKERSCSLNNNKPRKITEKYVNLYVRLTDFCQAGCEFCTFHKKVRVNNFSHGKFVSTVKSLLDSGIMINKVSFTGGEPTTRIGMLKACIKHICKVSPKTFIIVNTNGLQLEKLSDIGSIYSIALSRHHFNDDQNSSIFQTKRVPSSDLIRFMAGRNNNIHLSCNLIKGNIFDRETVLDYLEHVAGLGVFDVGFVGLMKVNKFCKDNFINFNRINFGNKRVVKNIRWNYGRSCRCANYLYLPRIGKNLIKFYARTVCKPSEMTGSSVVFDGQNLLAGFSGKVIL